MPAPTEHQSLRVSAAMEWYHNHMHFRPSLEEVAEAVFCSVSHLRRLFHAVHGRSPHAVLADARFARAYELLNEDRYSLMPSPSNVVLVAVARSVAHSCSDTVSALRPGVNPMSRGMEPVTCNAAQRGAMD